MKRIILLVTAFVFVLAVPFASAKDATRDELNTQWKAQQQATKLAAQKEKDKELADAKAAAAKETTKPAAKKKTTEKKN